MSTILDTDFEVADNTALAALFDSNLNASGRLQLDTTDFKFGAKSLQNRNGNGSSNAYFQKNVTAGTRTLAARFWFRGHTIPSSTQPVFQLNGSGAAMAFRINTAGRAQVIAGGTTQTSTNVLTLDAWFQIDVYFDLSTATYLSKCTIKKADGTALEAEFTATVASTANDITNIRIGQVGNATHDLNIDAMKVTDSLADYTNLGDGGPAAAAVASQLGVRHGLVLNPNKGLYLPVD